MVPSADEETIEIILRFIKDKLDETGARGLVVGLSGGLDSCAVLKLSEMAVGKERVHALLLPENEGDRDLKDAISFADDLKVKYEIIEIGPAVESLSSLLGSISRNSLGNIKARTRMIVLHAYAYENGLIVMGTSNKSEILTGYFTKFGDAGVDFMPIGDLYKTQLKEAARIVGIPERIIEKAPSAGLYEGQTDEDELGLTYEALDSILYGIERDLDDDGIAADTDINIAEIKRVREMVRKSIHKRKTPVIPKIGLRTAGWDWRE